MSSPLGLVQRPTPAVAGRSSDRLAAAESVTSTPQTEKEQPVPVTQAEPAPDETKAPPAKVLIVEDATELAEVIAATLERINIQSFHETHGGRALDVYHAEHPDLVLLDIGLPDMTGWKIIDAIRNEEEAKRPLVVVITAHGDPANRLMGKLQGVYTYLIKPFTPSEVERVVGNALASRLSGEAVTEETVVDSAESPAHADQPESSDAPQRDRDGAVSRS